MTTYATVADLRAQISTIYATRDEITDDDEAQNLLDRASELVDEFTMNRAKPAYDSEEGAGTTPYRDALSKATIRQVEFWMEVGPEHDVAGLHGSVVSGRLQIHPVANVLGPRTKRALLSVGLYWAGASIG